MQQHGDSGAMQRCLFLKSLPTLTYTHLVYQSPFAGRQTHSTVEVVVKIGGSEVDPWQLPKRVTSRNSLVQHRSFPTLRALSHNSVGQVKQKGVTLPACL